MDFDLTGKLLISTPAMGDPRFAHSVILLCAHGAEGAFGLIVNRPLKQITMTEVLEQIDLPASAHFKSRVVLSGGPVETQRGFVLHDGAPDGSKTGEDSAAQELENGLVLSASTDILNTIAEGAAPENWLLALGYAGWGPGQLEAELAQNAWLTCESASDLIFSPTPGTGQWHDALRSMGIDPLSLSAVAGRA